MAVFNTGYNGIYHYADPGSDRTQIVVDTDWQGSLGVVSNKAGIYVGGHGKDKNTSASHDLKTVSLTHRGNIETFGNSSIGILAESFGGYGDSGHSGAPVTSNFTIAIGGGGDMSIINRGYNGAGFLIQGAGGYGGSGKNHHGGAGPIYGLVDSNGVPTVGGIYNNASGHTVYVRTYYSGTPGIKISGQGGDGGKATGTYYGGDGADANGASSPWQIGTSDTGIWDVVTDQVDSGQPDNPADDAHGIWVVGSGGNGGHGHSGSNGSPGGRGGKGANIALWNSATVQTVRSNTRGARSNGLRVESIGGDGGDGGDADPGGAGGNADRGGKGGAITLGKGQFVFSSFTQGDESPGVYLESDGGTGGKGGGGTTGGDGGNGNDAGAITGNGTFTISTLGSLSHGVAAYSTGGDAGKGHGSYGSGGDSGAGDAVTLTVKGSISTAGPQAYGIIAQSIGGHAESASTCVGLVCFGADGGSAGDGGAVTVTNSAGITTKGDEPEAIVAHSTGGGGSGGDGFGVFYGQGGEAGKGGKGAWVTVNNSAALSTAGSDSTAIAAMSQGGSGGRGGSAGSLVAALGMKGGSGAHGGNVTVNNSGTIIAGYAGVAGGVPTSGSDPVCGNDKNGGGGCSHGIFAQSVGGGGGVAGTGGLSETDVFYSLWGTAGGDGHGGPVTVDYTGTLTTNGDGAAGIFAQSSSGTLKSSIPAPVHVTVNGRVYAHGTNSSAILVQSSWLQLFQQGSAPDPVGQDTITVDILNGSDIQGGYAGDVQKGAGVEFLDGVNNVLNNYGNIWALSGLAVKQSGYQNAAIGSGTATLNNYGTVTGNVEGAIAVNNLASGVCKTGPVSLLAPGSGVLNHGRIIIRDEKTIGTTDMQTDFVQTPTGAIVVDLDHVSGPVKGVHADLLTIGGTADLDGTVIVNVRDPGTGGIGRQSVTLIEAAGGLTAAPLAVNPSAVAQFQLAHTANNVDLSYDIDFANVAATQHLTGDQAQIASHVASQHTAGGIGPELFFLTEAADAAAYGESLEALSPAPYGVGGSASLMSGMQFADSLLSCKERAGENRFIREADCLRLDGGARYYSQDSTSGTPGFDLSWGGISLGGQTEVADGWIVGGGLAYAALNGSSDANLWGSDGEQFQAGLALKRQMGPALLAVSLAGGVGAIDVRRQAAPGVTAEGDQDFVSVSSQFRGAYAFEYTDWYIKPLADLNLTYVNTGSVTETGAGAANLRVDGSDEFHVSIRPAIEFGMELEADSGSGTLFRPRISVGVTQFLTDPSQSVTATFTGAAPGVAPFTVQNDMDRTSLDLAIGLDVFTRRNVQFSLNGATQISENAMNVGGSLRLAIAF